MKISETKIKICPYCNGSKVRIAYQDGYAALSQGFKSTRVVHDVCTSCGAILLSRVEKPEIFLKKEDKE